MQQPRSILSSLPSPQVYLAGGGSVAADYRRFSDQVWAAVSDPATAHTRLCDLLPDLWALRIRALAEDDITQRDNAEGIEAYYGRLLMRPVPEPLGYLSASVQMALRVITRVTDALGREDVPMLPAGLKASDLPTYAEMSVLLSMLPVSQRLFDFINSSLLMEMGISVFDSLLKQKRPMPSTEVLDEMCFIVNRASQTFGGAARHLGIVKKRSSGLPLPEPSGEITREMIAEEHFFANLGIQEWAEQAYN